MAHFRYQAVNAQKQPLTGELEAETVAQAIAQLEAEGLIVQSIGYATHEASGTESRQSGTVGQNPFQPAAIIPQSNIEQALLVRHMACVLERGRALVPALRAYAGEISSARRHRELLDVIRILERGNAQEAAAALQSLPTYWIPLLSAATSSGDPGRILREFLKESQRAEDLRRQWWQALAYPAFILAGVSALLIFFSFVVIPVFRSIFLGFGLKLPALTWFVLTLADWITSGRILLVVVLAVVAWLVVKQAIRLLPLGLRDCLDNRFGTLFGRSTALAQFSQFLADLLEAELEPVSAVRLAGLASHSSRLRRTTRSLAGEMDSGQEIAASSSRQIVTASILHALRADLPTKSRVKLLRELSSCHAERASVVLSWSRGVLEVVLVTVLGMIVGIIVIALFLPLISLIQGLSF